MSETLRKRRLRRTEGLIALFTADGKPAALLQLSLTSKLSVRRTDAQAGKGRISAGWREGSHTGWRRADVTHPLHTQRPPQDGTPSERVCLGYGGELIPAASTEVGNEIAMKRYFPEIETCLRHLFSELRHSCPAKSPRTSAHFRLQAQAFHFVDCHSDLLVPLLRF